MKSRWLQLLTGVWMAVCVGAIVSFGCTVISYPLITDNDGRGAFTVNTNGKAFIESKGVSAMVGGKEYEALNFIDQGVGGAQKLTTYELELAAGQLHGDTYCNPDWSGCAFWSIDYPAGASTCSFYGPGARMNLNCLNMTIFGGCLFYRSGECGRGSLKSPRGIQASDLASLIEMGIEGRNSLTFNLNAANTRIRLLSPAGSVTDLRLMGNLPVRVDLPSGQIVVDASSPNWASTLRKVATLSDNGFRNGMVEVTYGNVTRQFSYALLRGDTYRDILLRRGQ